MGSWKISTPRRTDFGEIEEILPRGVLFLWGIEDSARRDVLISSFLGIHDVMILRRDPEALVHAHDIIERINLYQTMLVRSAGGRGWVGPQEKNYLSSSGGL